MRSEPRPRLREPSSRGDREEGFAGIAIGLTLALSILAMGPVSNGSLNPARTFGPSLTANFWDDQWIYWVGPILGALIGAMGYTLLLGKGDD